MHTNSTETFVIYLNSTEMTSGPGIYYNSININIGDARLYKNFKLYIKDFFVIRGNVSQTKDTLFKLRTNTMRLLNSFDSATKSVSTQLAVLHNSYPMITNTYSDIGFDIPSLNGNHTFWLETDDGTTQAASPLTWFVTLIVIASN